MSFLEAKTKYFVKGKTWRMRGDKFQVPTAQTLRMSSKEEKANS